MRHTVKSHEVYHLWANELQDWAKSPGAMSFTGHDAYSFSAVIGRIVRNDAGERAYIVSDRRYSSSTSAHQSALRGSIPHGETVFYVLNWADESPAQALDGLIESLPELAVTAARARQNKPYAERVFADRVDNIRAFAAFMGLPTPDLSGNDYATIGERVRREKAETDRLAREHAERTQAAYAADNAERLVKWLAGEPVRAPNGFAFVQARIIAWRGGSGGYLETTQGATVPLAEVRDLLSILLRVLPLPRWRPEAPITIGGYNVAGYSDGVLTIGCHRFEAREVRRVAELLGL